MRANFFGRETTNIELLDSNQLKTLTMSALVSYFVIILCGTLGAPRAIASHVLHCGPDFNNCSLQNTLMNTMQICVMHPNIEVATDEYSFLFLEMGLKQGEVRASIAITYAIFDSDNFNLYKYCKENSFSIEHELARDWQSSVGASVFPTTSTNIYDL
jgi:hypothetical protein